MGFITDIKVISSNNEKTLLYNTSGTYSKYKLSEGYDTGKYYFEIVINEVIGNTAMYLSVGLCTDFEFTTWLGNAVTKSIGYWCDGTTWINGNGFVAQHSEEANKIRYKTGDTISFLLDIDNAKLTIKVNNIILSQYLQNIDISILKTGGRIYPTVMLNMINQKITINLSTNEFKYAIPTGYSPYDDSSTTYLLCENDYFYSIKPEYYMNGSFIKLVLNGGYCPNQNDFDNFGTHVSKMTNIMQIGEEQFIPINKFTNNIKIYSKKLVL